MNAIETDLKNRAKVIEDILHLETEIRHFRGPHSREAWMDVNLTIGQLKSLFFLDFEGSTSLGRLAGALGVTPPNVTGIIDRLVEQGMVSREENPENRRMLVVRLTLKGKALIEKLREHGTVTMKTILDRLSDEDLSALYRGLMALVKAWSPEGE